MLSRGNIIATLLWFSRSFRPAHKRYGMLLPVLAICMLLASFPAFGFDSFGFDSFGFNSFGFDSFGFNRFVEDYQPVPDQSVNLISNGDFTHGTGHWMLQADAPANARATVLDVPSTLSAAHGRVLHVDVAALGQHLWSVQVYQPGLDLIDGQPYTVNFWAHADRERTLDLNMSLDMPDWHTVGLAITRIPLTRDWHQYSYTFTASHISKGHNRLAFVLGDSAGMVELAQVSLANAVPGTASGPNLLEGADFSDNQADWSLQHSEGAEGRLEWRDAATGPSGETGRVAHLEVTTPGQHSWNVQFLQSGLDLTDRETYTLAFWARSDQERAMSVSMALDIPDWHPVGLEYQAQLARDWHRYSIVFTAAHTVKDHCRLAFLLGDGVGNVELEGMQLQQNLLPAPHAADTNAEEPQTSIKITPSAPTRSLVGVWENRTEDLSHRFRLTFNSDGTGSVRTGVAGQSR